MRTGSYLTVICLSLFLGGSPPGALGADRSAEVSRAGEILERAGVKGGLVVHVDCGDGKLTAALGTQDRYLVHGLDSDPADVKKAREHVRSVKKYGAVSIDHLRAKRLPYVDNLVNLLVVEDAEAVPREELLRVLAPAGVLLIQSEDSWKKTVKPRPREIDDWTHYLYDATNNAVSADVEVGPPRQLQWVCEPRWARSHDHLASMSAAVSSGGRIFYIIDEGPVAAVVLQPVWNLIGRDAFGGVLLWKRSIPSWQWHLRGFRSGPTEVSRRLVAVGDRVVVTLGIDAPVSVLDGATGETLKTLEGTSNALEFVHSDGTLFVVTGDRAVQEAVTRATRRGGRPGFEEVRSQRPGYAEIPPRKSLVAIHAGTGRILWRKSDADTSELMPSTLAVSGDRLFLQNADHVLCLNSKSGQEIWKADRPVSRSRPTWSTPTLVVYGDVVLSAERALAKAPPREKAGDSLQVAWTVSSAGGQSPPGELVAFSAEDGKRLWSCRSRECYNSPIDVLVAGDLVWTGDLVRASDPGFTEGRDPRTGEVKRTRPRDQESFACGMGHGRCYRNKATSRYLVVGRSGVEFVDVTTGRVVPNHWIRGTCQYGVIPCNGLLYAPPHSCACFIRSKLNGFNCLSPSGRSLETVAAESYTRLERGPAFSRSPGAVPESEADEWPTYRHDMGRSGITPSKVSHSLERAWQAPLSGKLSSVVVAGGRVLVASVDTHTVHALDAQDGARIWSHTAGGRIDSPPTVAGGRVFFGSADGRVYCVNLSDGELVWRFRAAPADRRIVSYGQVESAWPVSGNVLVRDGVVYCAAGRSSYLDGSMRLCRLEAKTGRLLSETIIDHRDPETGHQRKGAVRGTNMPGALPDVLSCDGDSVYLRHLRFDLEGKEQAPDVPHLFSAAGFLDDSWWHRTYWMLGTLMATNYGGWARVGNQAPAGRILAVDRSHVYGFGRTQYIHHGAHVGIDGSTVFHFKPDRDNRRRFTNYQLFAVSLPPSGAESGTPRKQARRRQAPRREYRWVRPVPILARALLVADEKLFLAGPPDLFEADDAARAIEGGEGGKLLVVSSVSGDQLAEYPLESPPVFDGMAAAGRRLYFATMDGKVVCFAPR